MDSMRLALYLLAMAVFALGTSEFMLAGLLPDIASDLGVTGRVSDEPINVCLYEGGLRTETHQGRRSLDIYEASTGRRVARQMMDDQNEEECPPYQVVYGDDPDPEPRQGDTAPPLSDYEAVLRPFLAGAPRS